MAIGEFYPGCEEILMFEISDFVIREYSKPKNTIQCVLLRFTRAFPSVWLSFISNPKKFVMKYLKNVCKTLIECQASITTM